LNYIYLIARFTVPKRLHGVQTGLTIRPLSDAEVISIEDQFFRQGEEQRIKRGSIAFILSEEIGAVSGIKDIITIMEFACSIIMVSGHPSFCCEAYFAKGKCRQARHITRSFPGSQDIRFVEGLTNIGILQWIKRCLLAQKNIKDRMHITASRFLRFAVSDSTADGIMDLCISLESVLDHQTEVSFRFSISLSRITGARGKDAEDTAALLTDLYETRSKLTHGDPRALKLISKLEPSIPKIKRLAKEILTIYVLFMSEHDREEWKEHVRKTLYS
jgi:hypothetical protein